MNKAEVIAKVKALALPFGEYIGVGSASLAVRGIREAADLDITVQPNLFNELAKNWPIDQEFLKKWQRKKLKVDGAEVCGDLYFENGKQFINNDELIKSADIIDGLPFQPLPSLLLCKLDIGRDKDVADIKLIRDYLKNHVNP